MRWVTVGRSRPSRLFAGSRVAPLSMLTRPQQVRSIHSPISFPGPLPIASSHRPALGAHRPTGQNQASSDRKIVAHRFELLGTFPSCAIPCRQTHLTFAPLLTPHVSLPFAPRCHDSFFYVHAGSSPAAKHRVVMPSCLLAFVPSSDLSLPCCLSSNYTPSNFRNSDTCNNSRCAR